MVVRPEGRSFSRGTCAPEDLRFQRAVERLHQCGPRPVYELLCEIGRERSCLTAIERLVERYGAIEPDIHHLIGSDRFAPTPMHEVA